MDAYRELLIGCGNRRDIRISPRTHGEVKTHWRDLVTVDIDLRCKPDLVVNLDRTPWCDMSGAERPDVLEATGVLRANAFREVHAYEVLEHLGRQGDAAAFFATFSEVWRVLAPDGLLCASVPARYSPWRWGDPGHTRVILPETLTFLFQNEYDKQVGVTPMTDYRDLYTADFAPVDARDDGKTFQFILCAVKPSRCTAVSQ